MEKKNANGVQTKAGEGGAPKKQLPYSVETPYGFYLDLDFLKYVDDIEKGNTIKRVHIQRRIKGPPKFSTLPRNFSLPGHGVRPVPKEKDSTWSGTSTLGPKPKSRVAEVQQIFDFRASERTTSTQSNRAAVSPGGGFSLAKPRDEAQEGEVKTILGQTRPNLLRASSMPITLQQRKGSDSSSPDRTVGTPESGSTENMFRASPDITERRCIPQDRTGLHQQITVALKRVRELEEQVKTIPELKAQIFSLKEEREQLLLQLQAHVSTSPSAVDPGSYTESQEHKPPERLSPSVSTQPTGVSECLPTKVITEKEKISVLVKDDRNQESVEICLTQKETGGQIRQKSDSQAQLSEEKVQPKATVKAPIEPQNVVEQELPSLVEVRQDASRIHHAVKEGKREDSKQKLQEKLSTLEAKLARATQELDRTSVLLKEQLQENKLKEEKILQLSEGVREEVCTAEAHNRSRRESIDTGTETDRVDFANRETETESLHTIDQGTDTDRICVEVHPPKAGTEGIDQGTETVIVDRCEQVTEMVEGAAAGPPRPRANSMERGTVTERIITQDQTTETPVAERINQVTETEGEVVTDHPQRPRTSSVARGTETERVDTVDRVTETVEAQRTDQETETEINRQPDNQTVNAESQEGGRTASKSESLIISERVKDEEESMESHRDTGDTETAVRPESLTVVVEIKHDQTTYSDEASLEAAGRGDADSKAEMVTAKNDSGTKEILPTKSEISQIVDTQPLTIETEDKGPKEDGETLRETIKEAVIGEKTVVPVRPQRGKKPPAADQAEPSTPQQPAPVRPRRGSSEAQSQQAQPSTKGQPQVQTQGPPQLEGTQVPHPGPSLSHNEDVAEKLQGEPGQKTPQTQTQTQGLTSGEPRPLPQATKTMRDSKELKGTQKGSSLSQTPQRGEGQARTMRQGSCDTRTQTQGSRKLSSEMKAAHKGGSDAQSLGRASDETAQRRGSGEAKASRRDSGDGQTPRRGSGESPTSPAALGQVVTRLTGLLGEQWAQLGSSSGAQQPASQQESPGAHKQMAGKRAEAGKGASAKPAGKAPTATAAGKATGKPGPSKMSSIQSQLVSSLSVLSAFYSPGQKATSASKQQEQGLKSIMKKDGVADKQGNKRAKKNLKFVGVNGGYESTSSEESSGEDKPKAAVEDEDSSGAEEEKKRKAEPQPAEKPEKEAEAQQKEEDVPAAEEGASAAEQRSDRGLLDPEGSSELLEEQAEGEKVDKRFIDACVYVKDRMEEVSSPDKEMRQVLVALYQEWFRVSSQKDSQADTVRSYLRQVSLTTPTLLPYVVNLTDGNGNMALHYCVSHSNFPVVKLLLDTGLCETDNMNKAGYTPVMLAALTAADSPDDLEVAQQLLKLGNVDACSRQAGQTALMLAVSHGRVAMVKLLLSCGADVNLQDYEGSTALMCASEHGHAHIVGLLLETGRCDLSLADK
ncbi:unnamed protein product, partial [Tetraodon nigroviridis]